MKLKRCHPRPEHAKRVPPQQLRKAEAEAGAAADLILPLEQQPADPLTVSEERSARGVYAWGRGRKKPILQQHVIA